MATITRSGAALGASTTNRKWQLDVVDPAATGTEAWIGVFGIQEFKNKPSDAGMQDDGDFDGGGYGSQTATTQAFGSELKVGRKSTAASTTAYDPGQEILRKAAQNLGVANRVKCRWYEMEPNGPRVEALTGFCAVGYSDDGGDVSAVSSASITLSGQGAPISRVHPGA